MSRPLLRVGLDVDEVVAELHKPWLVWINELLGTKFTVFDDWNFGLTQGLTQEQFYEFLVPEIYEQNIVKPIPGAITAVSCIRAQGFPITWVTSCGRKNEMADAKKEWLERWGFLGPHDGYLPTSDKSNAPVDILVDDHLKNCMSFNGTAVLVTRPHNAGRTWFGLRINQLSEILPILEPFKEE